MGALAAGQLTLADWVRRIDPSGKVDNKIAEVLSQQNEILEDVVMLEGNLPNGHQVTIRTGLPPAYYRSINQGVPTGKSTTAQVTEACAMLEAFSRIDEAEAELNGNTADFRWSEDVAFLESMNQQWADGLFYGNPATDPRQFLGLSGRYSSLSAANGANILSAGGSGSSLCSIWLVGWGEKSVFCPFPKGSKAGLTSVDDGKITVPDTNGNPYKVYQTQYKLRPALCVKDWRFVVRICNIDTSTFAGLTGTQATTAVATNIIHMMLRAIDRLPNFDGIRPAFYMNRSAFSLLRRLAVEKSINALALEAGANQFGTPMKWASFEGIPLRKVDRLLLTETTII